MRRTWPLPSAIVPAAHVSQAGPEYPGKHRHAVPPSVCTHAPWPLQAEVDEGQAGVTGFGQSAKQQRAEKPATQRSPNSQMPLPHTKKGSEGGDKDQWEQWTRQRMCGDE